MTFREAPKNFGIINTSYDQGCKLWLIIIYEKWKIAWLKVFWRNYKPAWNGKNVPENVRGDFQSWVPIFFKLSFSCENKFDDTKQNEDTPVYQSKKGKPHVEMVIHHIFWICRKIPKRGLCAKLFEDLKTST